MSLRFSESFDHYTDSADFTTKWNNRLGASSVPVISAGNGRNSTACMRLVGTGNGNGYLTKTFDSQQTWIIGIAFKLSAFSMFAAGGADLISLRDSGTLQCDLRLLLDGTLRATRNGTTLGTTTFSLSPGQFYYIEFKVKIDPSVGTIDIRVNGDSKLSLTGQNTRNSSVSSANEITIGNRVLVFSSNGNADFDDVYICDGQGSVNNDFLGDVRVQAILPSGAGATTAWTPSAGSNYQNVDEAAPNNDTDYNYSNTVNQVDTYAMGDVTPTAGAVKGIAVHMRARKDDAGTRTIAAAIRTGGSDYYGANKNLGTDYAYYTEIWETNPNTSVGFSIADVNGIEAGAKVIA